MNFCSRSLHWSHVSLVTRINFARLSKGNFFCRLNEVKVEIMLVDCCKRNHFLVPSSAGVNVNLVRGSLSPIVADGYMLR